VVFNILNRHYNILCKKTTCNNNNQYYANQPHIQKTTPAPLRLLPFLKKINPAPLLFSKFVKTLTRVHSGSCTPPVYRSWCQAKFLTSHHVRMHRVIFYIPNTLIKLIIWAWEFLFRYVGLGFGLG